jgi:hypothetical protein
MHALYRLHLARAIAITATAAVLAIVLTLAIATGLNDFATRPAGATAPIPAAALHASATDSGPSGASTLGPFMRSPFSRLLTIPSAKPWPVSQPGH